MAVLKFETLLTYGDYRGSVHPLREYEVKLPRERHATFLDDLGAAYQQALENVVGELDHGRWFGLEELRGHRDETEWMLRHDNYAANEENPDLLSTSISKALAALIEDTLNSAEFADTFWLEEDLVDKDIAELTTLSKRVRVAPPIVTERIALGTPCYRITPRQPYLSGIWRVVFNGTERYESERDYVPVSAVEAYVGKIEAFPLPKVLDKHNHWWARPADAKALEAIAPRRADAIRSARIRAAHKQFWAS